MAPLGQKKYLTLLFIKQFGPNKYLCANNFVALLKERYTQIERKNNVLPQKFEMFCGASLGTTALAELTFFSLV
jgi:hypothetical protein